MYKKIIKVLLINIIVFIFLVLIVELIFGDWFLQSVCYEGIGRDQYIWSYNEDTYYNYCSEIVKILELHRPNGKGKIYNFINKSAIRVENFDQIHQETKFDEYDVINIGDSFLQADEINFNETLSFVFSSNSGISALQIGYGSWAPITEYNFIRGKKLKPGVVVNLFVFMNDFTKTDYRSNIRYHTSFKNKLIDSKVKFVIKEKEKVRKGNVSRDWVNDLMQKSYFMRRIMYIYQQFKLKENQNSTKYNYLDDDFSVLSNDCAALSNVMNENISPRAKDYAEFSFNSSCWSDETISAVDNAISDIENIVEFVKAAGGKVNILLIPAGFSFTNENMAGKRQGWCSLSPNTTITTDGLAEYLEINLSTNFISLEKVIDKLKTYDKTEQWYFAADGHWNKHAHSQIGIWLADFYDSNMN